MTFISTLPRLTLAAIPSFLDGSAQPACAGPDVDPEWWFPLRGEHSGNLARAQAICHHCPLQEACADWAADTKQREGVWGGLTHDRLAARRNCRNGLCIHPEHRRTP